MEGQVDEYDEGGYYNDFGEWIDTRVKDDPELDKVDQEGRLIDQQRLWELSQPDLPEDFNLFLSKYENPWMSSPLDWEKGSKLAFPDLKFTVMLQRFDLYSCPSPAAMLGTTIEKDSSRYRRLPQFTPVRSFFVLNDHYEFTKEMQIDMAAPPQRNRFRPKDTINSRDLSDWTYKEKFIGLRGSKGVPGACDFFIQWSDSPDRYQITSDADPEVGWRMLYRFSAYPATQYYILEKKVYHHVLSAEGGSGWTYVMEKGARCFARKDWKVIGSFYAFDEALSGSTKYSVYQREDPFPRTIIAIGPIDRQEEWTMKFSFYAFDFALPGTCVFNLQHCIRSIHSIAASLARHRLTVEDPRMPWEFRMKIYVFPVQVDSISLVDYNIHAHE